MNIEAALNERRSHFVLQDEVKVLASPRIQRLHHCGVVHWHELRCVSNKVLRDGMQAAFRTRPLCRMKMPHSILVRLFQDTFGKQQATVYDVICQNFEVSTRLIKTQ